MGDNVMARPPIASRVYEDMVLVKLNDNNYDDVLYDVCSLMIARWLEKEEPIESIDIISRLMVLP